jgi:large subunit ribosomal protein L21
VGTPLIDGAKVAATVIGHLKGDKVLVFRKKRRKGFKRMNGHRQFLTQVLIQGILAKGETLKPEDEVVIKKPVKKAEAAPEVEESAEAEVKEAPAKKKTVKKTTTAKKKAPAKKTTTRKKK